MQSPFSVFHKHYFMLYQTSPVCPGLLFIWDCHTLPCVGRVLIRICLIPLYVPPRTPAVNIYPLPSQEGTQVLVSCWLMTFLLQSQAQIDQIPRRQLDLCCLHFQKPILMEEQKVEHLINMCLITECRVC